MRDEFIKNRTGKILGVIRYHDNGDQTALSYPGYKILGYYRASRNVTTDYYGRILSNGNSVSGLIYQHLAENGISFN